MRENLHYLSEYSRQEYIHTRQDGFHPLLTPDQSGRILGHIRQGATDTRAILQDDRLMDSIAPKELPQWAYVMAKYEKLPEFFGACYYRFVVKIARRNKGLLPIKDALSAGKMAVLGAVDDFDVAKDNQFFALAKWRILAGIQAEERTHLGISRYEQHGLQSLYKLDKVFWSVVGRRPTTEELRNQLLVNSKGSLNQIEFALARRENPMSLDAERGESPGFTGYAYIADEKVNVEEEAVQHVSSDEWRTVLDTAMVVRLTPGERVLINLAFGLDGKGRRTVTEIAAHYTVSPQKVTEDIYQALRKMQLSKGIQNLEESPNDLPSRKPELEHVIYEETKQEKIITQALKQQLDACTTVKDKVSLLFTEGFDRNETASYLGIHPKTVSGHLTILRRDGKIIPLPTREDLRREAEKDPLTRQVREYLSKTGEEKMQWQTGPKRIAEHTPQIKELMLKVKALFEVQPNMPRKQIAEATDAKINMVNYAIRLLRANGEL